MDSELAKYDLPLAGVTSAGKIYLECLILRTAEKVIFSMNEKKILLTLRYYMRSRSLGILSTNYREILLWKYF